MLKKRNKMLTFKINAPFRSCISKINNTFIDNAEDLNVFIPMYNFFRNFVELFIDEANYSANENNDADDASNYRINGGKTIRSKSFNYKIYIIGGTPHNNSILNVEVVVTLKYLSNFCISLDLILINRGIELDLTWSIYCVIPEISWTPEVGGANTADVTLITGAKF